MILINLIKVGAIWLTDLLNRLRPFKEKRFTDTADLRDLEERYSKDIETNFKNGGWFLYQKPAPEDSGDEALFQGLYLGMRVLKGANIDREWDAFQSLFQGEHKDILIRGFTADLKMNDTTSNDSATGALFALYCLWQHRGTMANDLIGRWAQRICESNYALTDLNNVRTKYGQLEDGWKTDPLRITLLLAILALAAKVDRNYLDIYDAIYEKYREILPYPKVRLLWLDTDYDTHRAAIHLHILWQLTHDTVYRDGLRRLHRITKPETNAWVQVLCSPVLEPEELNLTILNTFNPWFRDRGNIATKNSGTVLSVKWGSKTLAQQPLPVWRRGSQDFFWQRNMFSLDEWPGVVTPWAHHSHLDFLLVYWMGKRLGLTSQLSGVIL